MTSLESRAAPISKSQRQSDNDFDPPPIEMLLDSPTTIQRYTCVSILAGIVWYKYSFIGATEIPDGVDRHIHSWKIPVTITSLYLISLPLLRKCTEQYLSKKYDMKTLLNETMILYNASQVIINAWTVYIIVDGLLFRGHQFVGGAIHDVSTGAPYAVYIHYMDKYLEYLDTYFMVLRGKNEQVSI
jgi:elongation of very long chain fatty acids protein 4